MLGLLAAVTIALAWLVPNHYPPWSSFYNEVCMAVGLLLLVLAVPRVSSRPGMPGIVWVTAGVIAIPWLQWALGLLSFSGDAWVSSLYLLGFSLAMATGHAWARVDVKGLCLLLCCAVLTASVASAALALAQGFDVGSFGIWAESGETSIRVAANLGQPNNLATLIGFGVLGLLWLKEEGRLGKVSATFLLLLLMLGAGVIQSRSGLLYGPLIAVALLIFRRRGVPLQTRPWVAVGATVFYWGLTYSWSAIQAALLLQDRLSLAVKGVVSSRLQMWPLLVEALSAVPWTGYGWLQVGEAQMAAADKHASLNELWLQAHNLFLELVVWCGYPLGLLLGALILYWFVSRLVKVRTLEGAIGMMLVAILGAHSMLELPYHYAYFLIPAGLWIGMVEASIGAKTYFSPRWAIALAGITGALAIALCRDYPVVEEDFRLMRFENLGLRVPNPAEPAPDAPLLSGLTEFLRAARTVPVTGMTPAQLSRIEAVIKRYPYAGMMAEYAQALALNQRLDEALAVYNTLRHIHGEEMYARLKFSLHQQVLDGREEFKKLDQSLP